MSSASSCTLTDLKFSTILDGVIDLGITTRPRWRANDTQTLGEGERGKERREGGRDMQIKFGYNLIIPRKVGIPDISGLYSHT